MKYILFVLFVSGCANGIKYTSPISNVLKDSRDEAPINREPGKGYETIQVNEHTNPVIHYTGISTE